MEYGDGGTVIFLGLFIIVALVFMALLTEFFSRKNHSGHKALLKILQEKHARHEIGADEYRERSKLLEDEYWSEADGPEMMTLKSAMHDGKSIPGNMSKDESGLWREAEYPLLP